MAAREGSSPRSSRARAVDLLRIVTNLLTDDSNSGNTVQNEVERTVQHPVQSSSEQPGAASESGDTSIREGSVMQNFRNLFSGYRANPSTQSRPPPRKRFKRGVFFSKRYVDTRLFLLGVQSKLHCSVAQRENGSTGSRAGKKENRFWMQG